MRRRRVLAGLMLIALLPACSFGPRSGGGYYEDDGPHARVPVDPHNVAEPVPRAETRSATGNKPYTVFGVNYRPLADGQGYRERGIASWYGKKFHGRKTSSGEVYDMYALSAAHKTLPIPSYARVRNLGNGKSVIVRVNDRGPFKENRLIDLSYTAAARLGIVETGTGIVEVEAVTAADSGRVVAAPPAAPATPGASPRLFLQVGAFSQRANADLLRERLTAGQYGPVVVQNAAGGQGTVYRVRIGPLAGVDEGDRIAARVAADGVRGAHVVVE